jgi:hypothetical protein
MSSNRAYRVLALFVLAAVILTAPGWASPQSRRTPRTHTQSGLWSWLVQAVLKEGCTLDPDGRTCPGRSFVRPPFGGCSLDPDGCTQPLTGFNRDAG